MNVIIIGLGSVGKKHVKALLQNKEFNFNIYALRSTQSAGEEVPNVTNLRSLSNLDFEPDFFIVANPTSLHFNTIKNVLQFKKPLFLEKPIVMNLQEGQALANAFFKTPVLNYVACNLRFLEVLAFAKKFITDHSLRINEVNCYAGSYMPDWRPHLDYKKSYSANADMGGGIHLDFIHEIDYLYWFFGKPKSVSKILRSRSSLDISAVDYANYNYTYDQFVASVILNYYRKDRKRTFEVVAEQGTLLVLVEEGKVYFDKKLIFYSEQTILDTYEDQMNYFLRCIQNKEIPMNSFEEAFEVMKMCLNNE